MSLEIEATYENGILRLDEPLPFDEHERVVVSIQRKGGRARQSAGLIRWTGDPAELEVLLGPDSHPWDER